MKRKLKQKKNRFITQHKQKENLLKFFFLLHFKIQLNYIIATISLIKQKNH